MAKTGNSLNPILKGVITTLIASGILAGVAFASTIRERVTRLEAAFVGLHDDIKELKADVKLLLKK